MNHRGATGRCPAVVRFLALRPPRTATGRSAAGRIPLPSELCESSPPRVSRGAVRLLARPLCGLSVCTLGQARGLHGAPCDASPWCGVLLCSPPFVRPVVSRVQPVVGSPSLSARAHARRHGPHSPPPAFVRLKQGCRAAADSPSCRCAPARERPTQPECRMRDIGEGGGSARGPAGCDRLSGARNDAITAPRSYTGEPEAEPDPGFTLVVHHGRNTREVLELLAAGRAVCPWQLKWLGP